MIHYIFVVAFQLQRFDHLSMLSISCFLCQSNIPTHWFISVPPVYLHRVVFKDAFVMTIFTMTAPHFNLLGVLFVALSCITSLKQSDWSIHPWQTRSRDPVCHGLSVIVNTQKRKNLPISVLPFYNVFSLSTSSRHENS